MPIVCNPETTKKTDADFLPYRITIENYDIMPVVGTIHTTPIVINVEGINRIGFHRSPTHWVPYPEGSPADDETIQRILDTVPIVGQYFARPSNRRGSEIETGYGFERGWDSLTYRVRETEDGFEVVEEPSDDEIREFRRRYGVHND